MRRLQQLALVLGFAAISAFGAGNAITYTYTGDANSNSSSPSPNTNPATVQGAWFGRGPGAQPLLYTVETTGDLVFTNQSTAGQFNGGYMVQTRFNLSQADINNQTGGTGSYDLSSYMNFTATSSLGNTSTAYIDGAQVQTVLFRSSDLTTAVGTAYAGSPSGFGPNFAPLANNPSPNSGGSTPVILTADSYTLEQVFSASILNVSAGEQITLSMPNTSGLVGPGAPEVPEPGYYALLFVGCGLLVFAKKRRVAAATR